VPPLKVNRRINRIDYGNARTRKTNDGAGTVAAAGAAHVIFTFIHPPYGRGICLSFTREFTRAYTKQHSPP